MFVLAAARQHEGIAGIPLDAFGAAQGRPFSPDHVGDDPARGEIGLQRFAGAYACIACKDERRRRGKVATEPLRTVAGDQARGRIAMQRFRRLGGEAFVRDGRQLQVESVAGVEVQRARFGLGLRC